MSENATIQRKLTPSEISTLHTQLYPILLPTTTSQPDNNNEEVQSKEDATDLLDYLFAMMNNGKPVNTCVEELIGMEMDICGKLKAEKMGEVIMGYLEKHGVCSEQGDNDDG
eukprot:CAMPEP_0195524634 /NCGR_PEP_ID=MMETSP0794_2-20130614/24559_1 /TAXON_ID=515487 /ORGANISM="Stephanopyxis turris, Strain CCMP 815" /LENGTH=111 /DNA_ID=CAMNT_0040654889 /DNA_START=327 /DNA_END=659 /DNA_ORIENTATION=-